MDRSLARLRYRLTAYYVGSFAAILVLVGSGMFWVTAREVEQQLVRTLHAATGDAVRAAQVIEAEGVDSHEAAMAAVEEMEVPGSELFLFDARARPVTPQTAEAPVQAAAATALRLGAADAGYQGADGEWRVHARRFSMRGGRTYVAAATSDLGQIEAQSLRLIETFVAGAFLALVLVAVIGHRLAVLSVRPVETTLMQMRRFLADAAHELRTPVSVLRGRAEVALQRERAPGEYRAALETVGREAEAMGHIVDDLLTLARVESGVRAVAHERLFLDDLVSDAVSSAGVAAEARGVRLSVGEFDETPVLGDGPLLRQLLVILLQNAVKYTPTGGEVRVDVHRPGGHPTLVVRDTGIGIAADELPRVFERFYRGESARGVAEGAGLGLSIARRIAEEHRARITLASEVGHGTCVTTVFPSAD